MSLHTSRCVSNTGIANLKPALSRISAKRVIAPVLPWFKATKNHLRAECYPQDSGVKLVVSLCKDGKDSCLARMDLPAALPIKLKLRVEGLVASVLYQSNSEWKPVISDIDLRSLSTEHAGGFVGCTLGLYASGNGEDAGGYSDFERMTYRELPTN